MVERVYPSSTGLTVLAKFFCLYLLALAFSSAGQSPDRPAGVWTVRVEGSRFGGRANCLAVYDPQGEPYSPYFVIVGAARSSHALQHAPVRRPLHSSSCIEILRGLMQSEPRRPKAVLDWGHPSEGKSARGVSPHGPAGALTCTFASSRRGPPDNRRYTVHTTLATTLVTPLLPSRSGA